MANLSITARCNRKCSYCFAMETLDALGGDVAHMSLDGFERSLDFLQRSGMEEARLLGGEPTIHPDFPSMVDRVMDRGMRLMVFSGGMIPEKALAKLAAAPEERVRVLINVVAPQEGNPAGTRKQEAVYGRLRGRVILGLNITSPAVRPEFLLELIDTFGLARRVRLGVAHPTIDGSNEYLHPRHYPEVGRRVTLLGLRAAQRNVELDFDCGWVPCMFPDGALRALGKGSEEVGLRCNPILDLLPDGRAISCYPLASHAVAEVDMFDDAAALRARFASGQRSDRVLMLYKKCSDCDWRARGECTGGCLAGSMRRLRSAASTPDTPAPAIMPKRTPCIPLTVLQTRVSE